MEIEYTVKIKDKHNPPVFDEELGKGVVAKVTIDFKDANEDDYKHLRFIRAVYERGEELMDDYFEVTFDLTKFNLE